MPSRHSLRTRPRRHCHHRRAHRDQHLSPALPPIPPAITTATATIAITATAAAAAITSTAAARTLLQLEKLTTESKAEEDYMGMTVAIGEDEKSLLEVFGDAAKTWLLNHLAPTSDKQCQFNWKLARCEPRCQCSLQYRFGDYTVGRSCRMVRSRRRVGEAREVETASASARADRACNHRPTAKSYHQQPPTATNSVLSLQ